MEGIYLIKIDNLTKEFNSNNKKITAVKDVSMNIQKGEIYGIIGYSGAGKSTLLRCINRLEEPTSGTITIDGVDITNLNQKDLRHERKNIGMIFQHFNLLEQKTVYENIALPLNLNKENKESINKRVMELLKYVDLEDKKNSYPSELSGGQKQRVAIARAISNNPKILLSDEGTSALDPQTTKSILNLLNKIREELGITIVMITHQMEVVKEICDRVAIMENGIVVEENTVENIFTNPKTKTANIFINSLSGDDEEILIPENYSGQLIRLGFLGNSAKEPIVTELIRKVDVDVNILSGNINKLQETSVGHLIIELLGTDSNIKEAIDFLKSSNVQVEVL